MEANTLMLKALENPLLSFLSKIVLPAILFTFLYFRMQKATDQQLSQSNFFISGAIILYTVVNISHLVWFAILPIFVFIL
jgi:cytochrome c biogenesis protein CcdA